MGNPTGLPRDLARDWAGARVLHEQGESFSRIHKKTGIPTRTLKYRAKAEGWEKGTLAPELHNAEQQAAVKEFQKRGVDKAKVMAELIPVAFSNIKDFLGWDGKTLTLKPFAEIPRHLAGAISEVSQTKEGIKIRFHSKMDSLGKIGAELGMFQTDATKAVEAGIYAFYRAQLAEKRARK
jgi:hypothetical protein